MSFQREATIYDIARLLNISPSTVSRGLKGNQKISDKTRMLICKTAEQLGYQANVFASGLRSHRTNLIGIIVPWFNREPVPDIVSGIEQVTSTEEFSVIMAQTPGEEKGVPENTEMLYQKGVEGLITISTPGKSCFKYLEKLKKKNIPVISLGEDAGYPSYSTIGIDHYKVAYQAATHLISQNCHRIIYLSSGYDTQSLSGYIQALREHGFLCQENMILSIDPAYQNNYSARVIEIMQMMPDAILATDTPCLIRIMQELKKEGVRIPFDIACASLEDSSLALAMSLTAISYDTEEAGMLAAKTLLQCIKGRGPGVSGHHICLEHTLVVRESSQKIPMEV